MSLHLATPDLRIHPPRSPRVRLGGYVHLPRLLDKARAHQTGALGEYRYRCPLDARFFTFTGIDPDAFLAAVASTPSDTAALAWVRARAPREPLAIEAWSAWMSAHAPGDAEDHAWFAERLQDLAPGRDDITTYFDLLDLDDYVSFAGQG